MFGELCPNSSNLMRPDKPQTSTFWKAARTFSLSVVFARFDGGLDGFHAIVSAEALAEAFGGVSPLQVFVGKPLGFLGIFRQFREPRGEEGDDVDTLGRFRAGEEDQTLRERFPLPW